MPTYKHNDYYGYINKIQEKGIANPEWFWSESPDASEARQWLYNNGASAIVDDIYKNTPEEMKMKIPAKMLSNGIRQTRVTDYQREKTNDAADKTFKVGLGIAGAPALVSGFAAAPVATTMSMMTAIPYSWVFSKVGNRLGNKIYTRGTTSDGVGATISTNRKAGSEIGGLAGGAFGGIYGGYVGNMAESALLNRFGYADGISFRHTLYNLMSKLDKSPLHYEPQPNQFEGWYRPAETYSFGQRSSDMNQWSNWLDNITRAKSKWESGFDSYGMKRFYPSEGGSIKWASTENPTSGGVIEAGRNSSRFNAAMSAADQSLKYYANNGNFRSGYPEIVLNPYKKLSGSFHSENGVTIGVSDIYDINSQPFMEKTFDHNLYQTIGHELAHESPLFNTRAKLSSANLATLPDSPYYNNDYSTVPESWKTLLRASDKVTNPHNMEYSEGFSDLFGTRNDMAAKGINTGNKYSFLDLLRYRLSKSGRHNRFLHERPGWKRQLEALNTVTGKETIE